MSNTRNKTLDLRSGWWKLDEESRVIEDRFFPHFFSFPVLFFLFYFFFLWYHFFLLKSMVVPGTMFGEFSGWISLIVLYFSNLFLVRCKNILRNFKCIVEKERTNLPLSLQDISLYSTHFWHSRHLWGKSVFNLNTPNKHSM